MKRHWPILVLISLAAITALQTSSIHGRRKELEFLSARLSSFRHSLGPGVVVGPGPMTIIKSEYERLKLRASRIYILRGEVTLARQRQEELASRVQQLSETLHASTNQAAFRERVTFPSGYRPRNELADRGNHTLEAAIETYFWSLIHGDSSTWQTVNVKRTGQQMNDLGVASDWAEETKTLFVRFPGFRIISNKMGSSNIFRIVDIETAPGSPPLRFTMVHTAEGWKILNYEAPDIWPIQI